MQVALKDLEIRGAGNLLGAEQAGHIAGVGFDLYLRMIGEAVSAFRGDVAEGQTELRLELPVDAHIPEDYVDSERLRLEAYQKLSAASGPAAKDGQIDAVLDELVDRYGEPPDAGEAPRRDLPAAPPGAARRALRRHRHRVQAAHRAGEHPRLPSRPPRAPLPGCQALRAERRDPRAVPDAAAANCPSDADLIDWVSRLVTAIFPIPDAAAPAPEASATA